MVVLTSDHGHIVERRQGTQRAIPTSPADGPERDRARSATARCCVTGRRVLAARRPGGARCRRAAAVRAAQGRLPRRGSAGRGRRSGLLPRAGRRAATASEPGAGGAAGTRLVVRPSHARRGSRSRQRTSVPIPAPTPSSRRRRPAPTLFDDVGAGAREPVPVAGCGRESAGRGDDHSRARTRSSAPVAGRVDRDRRAGPCGCSRHFSPQPDRRLSRTTAAIATRGGAGRAARRRAARPAAAQRRGLRGAELSTPTASTVVLDEALLREQFEVSVMTPSVSPRRRREVIDALRRGTVPANGLDLLAVGLDRFDPRSTRSWTPSPPAGRCSRRSAASTAPARRSSPGGWPSGRSGAASPPPRCRSPRPRRRCTGWRPSTGGSPSRCAPPAFPPSALRPVLDAWLFTLESDVAAADPALRRAAQAVDDRRRAAAGAAARRGVRAHARLRRGAARLPQAPSSPGTAPPPTGWSPGSAASRTSPPPPSGRPASAGDLDHFGAMGFLQGLLTVLRDSGHPGLLLVLDEVETLQRVRGDVRDKALNALRQLIDEVDAGRFPGLYLVITGTPAFFDGPQGVQRLPPLAQRLATDFTTDARFDNPRAVQIRLPGFDHDRAGRARRARSVTSTPAGSDASERDRATSSTTPTSRDLATAVAGRARRQGRRRAARLPQEARRRRARPGRPVRRLRPAPALRADRRPRPS